MKLILKPLMHNEFVLTLVTSELSERLGILMFCQSKYVVFNIISKGSKRFDKFFMGYLISVAFSVHINCAASEMNLVFLIKMKKLSRLTAY